MTFMESIHVGADREALAEMDCCRPAHQLPDARQSNLETKMNVSRLTLTSRLLCQLHRLSCTRNMPASGTTLF